MKIDPTLVTSVIASLTPEKIGQASQAIVDALDERSTTELATAKTSMPELHGAVHALTTAVETGDSAMIAETATRVRNIATKIGASAFTANVLGEIGKSTRPTGS